MNISSDKLTCYIEGVYFPIKKLDVIFASNIFSKAKITIPLGSIIYPKMWANALVQVCYIDLDNQGKKKEKLMFQGLVFSLSINELGGELEISAESIWSCLNLNTTLDYTAPKRYGIKYLNEDLIIYIGNESKIEVTNDVEVDQYSLSSRYFFLEEQKDDIDLNSPEAFKLQFLIDRNPLAEKFAFSFFEDISYKNFYLTKSYLERFNLLNKVAGKSERFTLLEEAEENTLESSAFFLDLDIKRSGLFFKMTIKRVGNINYQNQGQQQTGTDVDVSFENLPQDFLDAVNAMATRLGAKADWFLAVMNFESAGTFNPAKRNPSSGATGLIQFMPKDAPGDVGKTTDELAAMTRLEQLKYVELYFSKKGKGRLKSLEDVAMCVFYPVAIGNPNYQFPPRVVNANNGINTPKEYVRRVLLNLPK